MIKIKIGFILIVGFAMFFTSCSKTTELVKPYVVHHSEVKESPLFLYNLPATMLEIEVTIKQTQNFKGPYADHARKFLGLEPGSIIQRNSVFFTVSDVKVRPSQVQDSSQWYAFIHNPALIPTFSVNENSSLTGFNMVSAQLNAAKQKETFNARQEETDRFFYDLGIQKVVDEEIQTVFRHVKRDSTIIKVPVQETVKSKKSEEEMARLTAEFITKIKNQRYELVAGLYEAFPEGRSLEASIRELYDVENRYVQLFTGVSIDTTYSYKFFYTPEYEDVAPVSKVLCYFDHENGITLISPRQQYSNNNKNQQLRIEIDFAKLQPLTNQKIIPAGPVYRIPALCNLSVVHGDRVLYNSKLNINQMGTIFQLPIDVLNQNRYKIEFDPETGNMLKLQSPDPVQEKPKK